MISIALPPDPYSILGVTKDSSLTAIRSAYKKLALSTHPDKVQDESLRAQKQDEFQKIQHAYEVLSDEEKRQEYEDQVRKAQAMAKEAEMMASRKSAPQFEVRSATFEVRTAAPRPEYERVYEQRKAARSFDEDIGYFDDRSSSRKHDLYGQGRKVSRGYDERAKGRGEEDDRDRGKAEMERQRAGDRTYQSERRRQRDKERRRETDDKYRRAAVNDEDDEDLEPRSYRNKAEEPTSTSRRRRDADELGLRSRDDSYRRETTRPRRANSHVDGDGFEKDVKRAQDYIQRSSQRGDRTLGEESHRPSAPHRASASDYYIRPSGVIPAEVDSVRRSHARRPSDRDAARGPSDRHRLSRKESSRVPVGIVEPPGLEPRVARGSAPSLPHTTSSPSALRASMSASSRIRRAETFHDSHRSPRNEPLPRSSTMPLDTERTSRSTRDPLTRGGSRLKGGQSADSGYSSPGTPDSPPLGSGYRKSRKDAEYVVVEEPFTPRGPNGRLHGAFVESESSESEFDEDRVRSVSPPRRSHAGRPPLFGEVSYQSSKHTPVGRSSSYLYVDEPSRASRRGSAREPSPTSRRGATRQESIRGVSHVSPGLLRTGSGFPTGRGGAPPFGRGDSGSHRSKTTYDDVAFTPRYGKDDIMYSTAAAAERRGSFGESGYAYRDDHFVHPGLMRAETSR